MGTEALARQRMGEPHSRQEKSTNPGSAGHLNLDNGKLERRGRLGPGAKALEKAKTEVPGW